LGHGPTADGTDFVVTIAEGRHARGVLNLSRARA
jgi:hypothetical protein